MRNLILSILMLVCGFSYAQTFDFSCAPTSTSPPQGIVNIYDEDGNLIQNINTHAIPVGSQGVTLTFEAVYTDADGNDLTYTWDGIDLTAERGDVFFSVGDHEFSLIVNDGIETTRSDFRFTVEWEQVLPSGSISIDGISDINAIQIETGDAIELTFSASFSDGNGDELTYLWLGSNGETGTSYTREFPAGEHTVSVHVSDGSGPVVQENITFTILPFECEELDVTKSTSSSFSFVDGQTSLFVTAASTVGTLTATFFINGIETNGGLSDPSSGTYGIQTSSYMRDINDGVTIDVRVTDIDGCTKTISNHVDVGFHQELPMTYSVIPQSQAEIATWTEGDDPNAFGIQRIHITKQGDGRYQIEYINVRAEQTEVILDGQPTNVFRNNPPYRNLTADQVRIRLAGSIARGDLNLN